MSGFGTLTGQGNGQGGREHGQKADQLPGYRKLDDPGHRAGDDLDQEDEKDENIDDLDMKDGEVGETDSTVTMDEDDMDEDDAQDDFDDDDLAEDDDLDDRDAVALKP